MKHREVLDSRGADSGAKTLPFDLPLYISSSRYLPFKNQGKSNLLQRVWFFHIRDVLRLRFRFFKKKSFQFSRSLVFACFRLWLGKIENPERLPKRGPAILVSNHVSYYDWAVLASVLRRQTVFVGASELSQRPVVQWLMKLNTLIYIDREKPGFSFFKEVMRHLKEDKIVVIYPEGTRSRTGKRQTAKHGFVKLALVAQVPIIPLAMRGTYEILPPDRKLPKFRKCEMSVGEPLLITSSTKRFEDIFDREQNKRRLGIVAMQEIGERIMDAVGDLAGSSWDDGVVRKKHHEAWSVVGQATFVKLPGVAAFFDVDKTLVHCHTQIELALFCRKKGMLTFSDLSKIRLWSALSRLSVSRDTRSFREHMYQVLTHHSTDRWDQFFEELFERSIRPEIYHEAIKAIKWHRRLGHKIVLVSASIENIVRRLQKEVCADYVLATELEVRSDFYSGRIRGEVLRGQAKAAAVRSWAKEYNIDLSQSYAYGNDYSDVRMLSVVRYPIAVNADRRLSKYASRKGWQIVRFA